MKRPPSFLFHQNRSLLSWNESKSKQRQYCWETGLRFLYSGNQLLIPEYLDFNDPVQNVTGHGHNIQAFGSETRGPQSVFFQYIRWHQ